MTTLRVVVFALAVLAWPAVVLPQTPPGGGEPARPPWTYAVGGGITVTTGNSDTMSFNTSFKLSSPASGRRVFKTDGLYLRSASGEGTTANRVSFNVRDEWRPTERGYFFSQFQFLNDEFKAIDYLIAPTAGWGYRVLDGGSRVLSIDGSAGVVWERNPKRAGTPSAAVSLAQKFSWPLSKTATFTQSLSGLWRVRAFDDTLYTFGASVTAAITTKIRLKFEVLDTFKTRPAGSASRRNDMAMIASVVFGS